MCRTAWMPASQEGSCPVIVDSSSIMKAPASAWSFRIGWAPVAPADSQSTIIRYQVQLICVETGKRHAFYTPDDLPSVVLANREVRQKVGDAFTVQIRVLRSDNVGVWSEASEVFSVAKSSPNLSLQACQIVSKVFSVAKASALPQPSLTPRKKPAFEAFACTDTKNAPDKKREEECGGVTKRQQSMDRVAPKFHRPMATARKTFPFTSDSASMDIRRRTSSYVDEQIETLSQRLKTVQRFRSQSLSR